MKASRYEHFTRDFDGEREVARFWIAGSLKSIEARVRRENGPAGQRPSLFEMTMAASIAAGAIALVTALL